MYLPKRVDLFGSDGIRAKDANENEKEKGK